MQAHPHICMHSHLCLTWPRPVELMGWRPGPSDLLVQLAQRRRVARMLANTTALKGWPPFLLQGMLLDSGASTHCLMAHVGT